MNGVIIAFIMYVLVGLFFVGIGINGFVSKKPIGFWANIKQFYVNDIKGYNHATGKLFITYGIVFILLGIPLLSGQNSPYILLSILGIMFETIICMVIYTVFITEKYREK